MTYPYPDGQDILATATDAELADLADVLDEVEAEGYGPDEADPELSGYYGGGTVDLSYGDPEAITLAGDDPLAYVQDQQLARVLELARQSEDAEDAERAAGPRQRRYTAEERLSRALDRISQGTYTSPAAGTAELSNASGNCGYTDPATGLCAAPFHQLGCTSAHVSSSATGDIDDMDAWRSVVLAHDGREVDAIELATAHQTGPGGDELLGPEYEPGDSATYYEMRRVLGLQHKPGPVPLRPVPQITARQLGIG